MDENTKAVKLKTLSTCFSGRLAELISKACFNRENLRDAQVEQRIIIDSFLLGHSHLGKAF